MEHFITLQKDITTKLYISGLVPTNETAVPFNLVKECPKGKTCFIEKG